MNGEDVLLCTTRAFEAHHHASRMVLAHMAGYRYRICARTISLPETGLPNVVGRVDLDDAPAVETVLDQVSLVHAIPGSDAVFRVVDLARSRNVPVVLSFLGGYDASAKLKRRSYRLRLRELDGLVSCVTAPSRRQSTALRELLPRTRVVYVPVPIWPVEERIRDAGGAADLLRRLNGRYAVSCSRFVPRKAMHRSIEALAFLPSDLTLVMIGHGPTSAYCHDVAERLGLMHRVRFAGALGLEDALRVLRGACALLHLCEQGPEGDEEGVPQIVLWAQKLGVPVFATPSGGLEEVVTDGVTGTLVGELGSSFDSLFRDRIADERLVREARRLAERDHEIDVTVDAMRKAYAYGRVGAAGARHCGRVPSEEDGRKRAQAIVETIDDAAQIVRFWRSRRHLVAQVRLANGRMAALKLRVAVRSRRELDSPSLGGRGLTGPAAREIEVLAALSAWDVDWAPRLLTYDENANWLLRSWSAGTPLDRVPPEVWSRTATHEFLRFAQRVFCAFHSHKPPCLVKDFKPRNVAWDGRKFELFDLDSVDRTARVAEQSTTTTKLGEGTHRYWAPEILTGDANNVTAAADVFSLGTSVFKLICGFVPWRNLEKEPGAARFSYLREYDRVIDCFASTLDRGKYGDEEAQFLRALVDPTVETRRRLLERGDRTRLRLPDDVAQ